jgi:hypothetical protein
MSRKHHFSTNQTKKHWQSGKRFVRTTGHITSSTKRQNARTFGVTTNCTGRNETQSGASDIRTIQHPTVPLPGSGCARTGNDEDSLKKRGISRTGSVSLSNAGRTTKHTGNRKMQNDGYPTNERKRKHEERTWRIISIIVCICYNFRTMRNEPVKKITVPEGSSLAKLLTDAADSPILLEKNGELYRLERMGNKDNTPSPEEVTRSRDGIRKAAGSWKNIDTEAFKAYIKDRRQTANRPSVKL